MPDYSTTLSRGCKLLKGLGLCPPGRDNLSAGCLEIPGAAARAEAARDRDTPAMLGTLMTALFFVARVVRQVSLGWPGGAGSIYCCSAVLPCLGLLCWGRERRQQLLLALLCLLHHAGQEGWELWGLSAVCGLLQARDEWQGRAVVSADGCG